ncbi:MAG: MFS transporter [Granulosicoccaceae bacterium]
MTDRPLASALNRDVLLLSFCQAMMTSTNSLVVACSALVGMALASDPLLGTLPAALQHLATMTFTLPASLLMAKLGRRAGFAVGACIGILGGYCAWQGIVQQSFAVFALGTALFGVHNSFGNFFRFAAVEATPVSVKNRAISYVLAGGVLAAVLGPSIASWTRLSIEDAPFAGSFIAVMGLYLMTLLAVSQLSLNQPTVLPSADKGRTIRQIAAQPLFRVAVLIATAGYALMVLLMTATPLAMAAHQHPFADTAVVIQFHVLAMFLPSFYTGNLIERLGIRRVMAMGVVLGLATSATALAGHGFWWFFIALVFLGLSWNFMFVAATSLLTECYKPEEKARVQAFNDFVIFSTVGLCAFGAGAMQSFFGWGLLCMLAVPLYLGAGFAVWRLPPKVQRQALAQGS